MSSLKTTRESNNINTIIKDKLALYSAKISTMNSRNQSNAKGAKAKNIILNAKQNIKSNMNNQIFANVKDHILKTNINLAQHYSFSSLAKDDEPKTKKKLSHFAIAYKLSSLILLEKKMYYNLLKYNVTETSYNVQKINDIIYDERKHIVCLFKNFLLWDEPSDFLKRFYYKEESVDRLPKITGYYEKYTLFPPVYFCLDELVRIMLKNVKRKKKYLEKLEENEDNMENMEVYEGKNEDEKNKAFKYLINPKDISEDKNKSLSVYKIEGYEKSNNASINDYKQLLNFEFSRSVSHFGGNDMSQMSIYKKSICFDVSREIANEELLKIKEKEKQKESLKGSANKFVSINNSNFNTKGLSNLESKAQSNVNSNLKQEKIREKSSNKNSHKVSLNLNQNFTNGNNSSRKSNSNNTYTNQNINVNSNVNANTKGSSNKNQKRKIEIKKLVLQNLNSNNLNLNQDNICTIQFDKGDELDRILNPKNPLDDLIKTYDIKEQNLTERLKLTSSINKNINQTHVNKNIKSNISRTVANTSKNKSKNRPKTNLVIPSQKGINEQIKFNTIENMLKLIKYPTKETSSTKLSNRQNSISGSKNKTNKKIKNNLVMNPNLLIKNGVKHRKNYITKLNLNDNDNENSQSYREGSYSANKKGSKNGQSSKNKYGNDYSNNNCNFNNCSNYSKSVAITTPNVKPEIKNDNRKNNNLIMPSSIYNINLNLNLGHINNNFGKISNGCSNNISNTASNNVSVTCSNRKTINLQSGGTKPPSKNINLKCECINSNKTKGSHISLNNNQNINSNNKQVQTVTGTGNMNQINQNQNSNTGQDKDTVVFNSNTHWYSNSNSIVNSIKIKTDSKTGNYNYNYIPTSQNQTSNNQLHNQSSRSKNIPSSSHSKNFHNSKNKHNNINILLKKKESASKTKQKTSLDLNFNDVHISINKNTTNHIQNLSRGQNFQNYQNYQNYHSSNSNANELLSGNMDTSSNNSNNIVNSISKQYQQSVNININYGGSSNSRNNNTERGSRNEGSGGNRTVGKLSNSVSNRSKHLVIPVKKDEDKKFKKLKIGNYKNNNRGGGYNLSRIRKKPVIDLQSNNKMYSLTSRNEIENVPFELINKIIK